MNSKISVIILYLGLLVFYLVDSQFEQYFNNNKWGLPLLYLSNLLIVVGLGLIVTKLFHYEKILKEKSKNGKKKVGINEYLKKDYLEE